ncbi:MAG: hypothetical protein H7Y88_05530 [Phycisphaerales bacterium]|nr:hypothetical protein [Phycisphaerales bacterium]
MELCTLLAKSEEVYFVLFGGAFTVAIVAIISDCITRTTKSRNSELTKRELGAYVAEGSISADDAAKIIAAGRSAKSAAKTDA